MARLGFDTIDGRAAARAPTAIHDVRGGGCPPSQRCWCPLHLQPGASVEPVPCLTRGVNGIRSFHHRGANDKTQVLHVDAFAHDTLLDVRDVRWARHTSVRPGHATTLRTVSFAPRLDGLRRQGRQAWTHDGPLPPPGLTGPTKRVRARARGGRPSLTQHVGLPDPSGVRQTRLGYGYGTRRDGRWKEIRDSGLQELRRGGLELEVHRNEPRIAGERCNARMDRLAIDDHVGIRNR